MRKTEKLKNMIKSKDLEIIMEAHNGLSAKIVEEAGFKGIWASGLSISAALGVRDNNEASWTQILEILEFMSDATSIPILLDGDTGYGNFNNARRLVKKLEQRDIAGVCIEDKLFPKTNSFIKGDEQSLTDIDEFCGKIRAMKDVQTDKDFVVVARLEAFIAGLGLKEALTRADAYRLAGADAILVHSKKSDSTDIDAFMKEWSNRLPVVIVPTKYYSVPTDKFRDLGISLVIWANHNIRSSVISMQRTTKQIFNDQSLINVEDKISPISEIFRLQGADELMEAEERYLPATGKNINAIILAAAQGDKLGVLTKDIPKALLKVNGKSILSNQIDAFQGMGIKDICIVRGFGKDKIKENVKMIDNDEYATTTELYSLYLATKNIKNNTIISYGDIVFKNYILHELLNDIDDITIIVDADYEIDGNYHDYVKTNIPYSRRVIFQPIEFIKMISLENKGGIDGEFIGLFKMNERGGEIVKITLQNMSKGPNFRKQRMKDLFNEISKSHKISVKFIKGSWLDINSIVDLQKAEGF